MQRAPVTGGVTRVRPRAAVRRFASPRSAALGSLACRFATVLFIAYLYIAMYTTVALWGIREDMRWEAPRWKATLSVVGNALGIAGMVLWAAGEADPKLAVVWRWVLPGLVIQLAIEVVYEYRLRLRRMLPEGELSDAQIRSLVWTSIGLGLLTAAPFFWMNYQLAFPGV